MEGHEMAEIIAGDAIRNTQKTGTEKTKDAAAMTSINQRRFAAG